MSQQEGCAVLTKVVTDRGLSVDAALCTTLSDKQLPTHNLAWPAGVGMGRSTDVHPARTPTCSGPRAAAGARGSLQRVPRLGALTTGGGPQKSVLFRVQGGQHLGECWSSSLSLTAPLEHAVSPRQNACTARQLLPSFQHVQLQCALVPVIGRTSTAGQLSNRFKHACCLSGDHSLHGRGLHATRRQRMQLGQPRVVSANRLQRHVWEAVTQQRSQLMKDGRWGRVGSAIVVPKRAVSQH
mmetsp:Transcript_25466/g.75278  ORF Transcript_25466/g.75278 Transcript_25466/m.75278 type:complete len:240 (-) Transcript_25466:1274-1993(-)